MILFVCLFFDGSHPYVRGTSWNGSFCECGGAYRMDCISVRVACRGFLLVLFNSPRWHACMQPARMGVRVTLLARCTSMPHAHT